VPRAAAAGDWLCGRDGLGPPQGRSVAGSEGRGPVQRGFLAGPSRPVPCPWAFGPNRGPRSSSAECCSNCWRIASRGPRGFPGASDSGEGGPSCSWWGSAVGIGRGIFSPHGKGAPCGAPLDRLPGCGLTPPGSWSLPMW
jgi:hypothetical protein